VGLLHRGKRGRVGRSAMLLSIGLYHRRVCGRLSNGLQHRRVSGRLPNGLVNMRVECTLPTNTRKPNSSTINTIEHAGTFACRVCFDCLLCMSAIMSRVTMPTSKIAGPSFAIACIPPPPFTITDAIRKRVGTRTRLPRLSVSFELSTHVLSLS
jgi:hypothetical protein